MNVNQQKASTTPHLVSKLCTHFARNNEVQSALYFKKCLTLLSTPSFDVEYNEQQIATQLRRLIQKSNSLDKVEAFDDLHMRIQNSTVLQCKPQLLAFFLSLIGGGGNVDTRQWTFSEDMFKLNTIPHSFMKSQHNFLPDFPSVGEKKVHQVKLNKKASTISNRTQQSIPTVIWTSSTEPEMFKDNASSVCSSLSTISTSYTEGELIKEVIYSFQGIEGKLIRKEPGGLGFSIDPKGGKYLTARQRGKILRLIGIGFLHNQLKQHCEEADKQMGLIGQALIAIVRTELTHYYQLIAILQAQSKNVSSDNRIEMTLRRMIVWVAEPQLKLQWLAHIVEQCVDKKGGALISAIYGFLQHGSKGFQTLSETVLSAVCRPLYVMLSKWLLNGELNDPCAEFFIEARTINDVERLWHDKYHVRRAMVPTFITLDQANKILITGKSINFLRQICKDTDELPGRDAVHKLCVNSLDALFNPEQSIELHTALEVVYMETSARVLHLLKYKHMLIEHLQAMRRYLLLGQGDFIRHLLELLAPELSQPAYLLFSHTLSAILDSAVRLTSAQYDDEEMISRLSVCLLQHSNEDSGWDVFSLIYAPSGPVGTIFHPTISTYKGLFGGLWRAKRMEFVLSNMRKQQITNNKVLRRLKELKTVTHQIYVISSEMIHFLHQTQYYFNFEVLECSWHEMMRHVNAATSLDDVITAHNTFLSSVQNGVLLDASSEELRKYLGSIFNLVLRLEAAQGSLYETALKEKTYLDEYTKMTETASFGLTRDRELEHRERKGRFAHFLTTVNSQITSISTNFRQYVIKYVTLLANNSNLNLQLLATRLNFNDYYKIA